MRTPSPAILVSTLALAVALTGTAGATGLINGQSIRNHSITANKLAAGAVTGRAIRKASITTTDLAPGVIVNNTIDAPKGDKGDPGTPGVPGVAVVDPSKIITVNGPDVIVLQHSTARSDAVCPDGTYVIGGGFNELQSTPPAEVVPISSQLSVIFGNQAWSVVGQNFGGYDQQASWHAIAYCAPVA